MEHIERTMSAVFENKYSSTVLTVIILLYASLASPKLPNFIIKVFENPVFRVLFLSLIVYKGNRDPVFSIMIATVFTLVTNMISQQRFFENFTVNGDSTGTGTDTDTDATGDATDDSTDTTDDATNNATNNATDDATGDATGDATSDGADNSTGDE